MNTTSITVTILGCLLLLSCSKKPQLAPPPIPVNLYTVTAQPVVYFDRYTATTVALSQVNLLPEVQGYITGIFFTEGTSVRKGQKLYEIDRRIYEANYNAAAANLNVAEGNLKQAQQDADRYEYLYNNKAVAKQLYDHAMITLENSRNAYKSAEEALKTASTSLAYSVITAPFDGTIGFSQVKMGDLMTVGQTVLVTVSSDDPMGVDFLISEKQLSAFDALEKTRHTTADSLFTLILPNNSAYPYPGTIAVIDRAVNPQTGSVRIRLHFPNPKSALRAGMSCVVRVHNTDTSPQLLIPNRAVVEEMGEFFVYVEKDSAPGGGSETAKDPAPGTSHRTSYAFQKKVQLGATLGPDVIIRGGIAEGDRIVADGVQSLHNGSQIAPSDDRSAPRAGIEGGPGQNVSQGKR
ncbi:MAG TPA: efflux RND transporter periplasmic adaptor subunit [Bacteroidota bacterium]|nr:efflux RND transporter periplasmic adaptor subunit [Bacteroidota bacterium]